jgi:hypothetical protein
MPDDDAPAPKKSETKRKTKAEVEGGGEKPKTKRTEKPASPDAEPVAAEKPKTKRVANQRAEASADPKTAAAPSPAEAPAAEPPAKTKTGKKPRPEGDAEKPEPKKGDTAKKKKPAGDRPGRRGTGGAEGPAAPPPPKRGGFEYALAVLGPVVGVAGGLVAFLLLSKGVARAASPVLPYANPAGVADAIGIGFAVIFKPAPILVGLVAGLLVTFEALKMAPGTATRIMSVLTLLLTVCAVMPFILAGRTLNAKLLADVESTYKTPRGTEPDARALDLTISADEFALRQLRAMFKIDLEEGEIPASWVATNVNMPADPKADEKAGEKEGAIHFFELRQAFAWCRELQGKFKAEVEPILAKLEPLRDKAADLVKVPDEETQKLEDGWNKFKGKLRRDLAKPPKPKNAGEWFTKDTAFDINKQHGISDPTEADLPFAMKVYLGKAVHAVVKDLPPEMRFAGVLQVEVPLDYVPKDDAEKALTKYDFVYACYDLEKPDREPVLVPQLKGILGEAHFKMEVLGEK